MQAFGMTDRGVVRKQNQDAYRIDELQPGVLSCVVCDGMGGARAGDVAAQVGVEIFGERMRADYDPTGVVSLPDVVQGAVRAASGQIAALAAENPEFRGMGSTLVAAVFEGDRMVIANVGDSRAYLVTDDKLEQITRDHSVVEAMVARGDITREEAATHPQRNLITRALGMDSSVRVDLFYRAFSEGEGILLCSDGLVNSISESEIFRILRSEPDSEAACRSLMDGALEAGAPDNVTVLLVRR